MSVRRYNGLGKTREITTEFGTREARFESE